MKEATLPFLKEIEAIIKKYDSLALESGENFNVFNILDLGSREVRLHSALIAELLNPKGNHGLGTAMLSNFINIVKTKKDPSTDDEYFDRFINTATKIEPEKWIVNSKNEISTRGYIDILIQSANKDAIIIENKIYAEDQEAQLRRYHEYQKNATIIYLTLDGKDADNETTKNDQNPNDIINPILISYKTDILKWLEKCKENTIQHPLVSATLTQYIYLIKQLTHQSNNKMKNEIVDLILEKPEHIQIAQEIWKNKEAIKYKIIEKLMVKLGEKAGEEHKDWVFDIKGEKGKIGKSASGFGFRPKQKHDFWVHYYFSNDFDILEVGIDWAIDVVKKDTSKEAKLKEHFLQFELDNRVPGWDIWGIEFQAWNKDEKWANVLIEMPDNIIKTTGIILDHLRKFNY